MQHDSINVGTGIQEEEIFTNLKCSLYTYFLAFHVSQAADYEKEGSVLRIRGKNILENEHVKVSDVWDWRLRFNSVNVWFFSPVSDTYFLFQIGAFHTLELELQRPFVLRKVWCLDLKGALFAGHLCTYYIHMAYTMKNVFTFSSVGILLYLVPKSIGKFGTLFLFSSCYF